MSSKDDIEAGKPLLRKMDTHDREEISELEAIGQPDTSAHFYAAAQRAVRMGILMFLAACIIWVKPVRAMIPLMNAQIQGMIPLVICLLVCTANPIFGTSLQGGIMGFIGTFWACLHMWIMNGIFPGGMKEGMSPTSATAIFGWVNMLVFLWVVLWCNCGMGTKMFAMSTDIGFMLAFLNPASTVPFSENFTISSKGTAVNTLLACLIASLGAPLFNLLPYPMVFAFNDMKDAAVKTASDTANLFDHIAAYYCGKEATVVIEAEIKHSLDLRADLDAMGGSIGAAWWEGFDMGSRGVVRAFMQAHVSLSNDVYDRLRAVVVAVSSEDFGPSHVKVADAIRRSTRQVTQAVKKLLLAATDAASDGDISSSEKAELLKLVQEAKAAVKQMGKDFDAVRRSMGKPVNADLLGESFFVISISAYARIVWEYTEMICSTPPQGVGLGSVMMASISSTWDMSAMTERFHMNFVVKHYIAIVFCWFYSVYVDGFGGGCVITAVFLMNPSINPDIQGLLNVLIAVVMAVVIGALVFQTACSNGGDTTLMVSAYVMWNLSLFGFYSGGYLALPFLLVAALSPFKWVASCPTGDVSAGARALWGGIVANCLAIFFVSGFQFFLAPGRASVLAVDSMDAAFNDIKKSFGNFWEAKDAKEAMGSVAGNLGSGAGYNASAIIEPRFWRAGWKGGLYSDVVASCRQVRLDILMMSFAMEGSDGKADAIFDKFSHAPEFLEVKSDLNTTLDDAHRLVISILSHEDGHINPIKQMKVLTGVDVLDALPGLIESVGKEGLKFPTKLEDSMEDDELCQIAAVFLMLDACVKHIADLLKAAIRY